jgi:energy-coupling factor transporter ATP-binding protein EcfA2
MLSDVISLDQSTLEEVLRFTVRAGTNTLVFGPAGCGKTQIAQAIAQESGYEPVYVDLSVLENCDFVGLPVISDDKKFVNYATPQWMPCTDTLGENSRKRVMIFDELDKSKPELQYPLLELLMERSINGRPVAVQACFLTGNLPDEGAFSQPINHALTNRCSVYRVEPNFESWQTWARREGLNPLVVGYLDRHQEKMLQKPAEGDPTAYCHASPRAWTLAASDLDKAGDRVSVDFQTMLVAARVGMSTATDFRVWLEHYRHIEPLIEKLVNTGEHPPTNLTIDRLLVLALSSVGRISQLARHQKKPDEVKVRKAVSNVFGWLKGIQSEFQIAAVKNSLDMKIIQDFKMIQDASFIQVFNKINTALRNK